MRILPAVILFPLALAAAERPYNIRSVPVYHEAGRFGGWPANHGIWSWDNEILVGFSAAWYQRQSSWKRCVSMV